MKILRIILIMLLPTVVAPLFAQNTVDTKEPRWKQLNQAYGFLIAQQVSLELIEKKFPELATATKEAWFAFNSTALGEGAKGVEEDLSKKYGTKWPEYKKTMTSQISETHENYNLTRQQASDFISEVKQRAKGNIPESILATLLSAHARYAKNPGFEIIDGWKQTFRTKDHPKAKGVDFSVSFPASWSRREGNRPNIIHVFQNGAGHGPVMCVLMVKDIPVPAGYKPTKEEIREIFQASELKDMVPAGGTFVEAKSIVLEDSPAVMLVSDQTRQRMDTSFTMRMTQFVTIQGSSMITIQFMAGKTSDSSESSDDLHKRYLPTYRIIANTLVLNDRYK